MKVLIVHYYVGQGGGAETAVRNQIKALSLHGVKATVTTKDPFLYTDLLDGVDLVHFHTIHVTMGLSPLERAQKRGFPHCISLHDYWPICFERMLLRTFDKGCSAVDGVCDGNCRYPKVSSQFATILEKTPTIIFNRKSAEIMERNGIKISAIIPHGIDTDFFYCPDGPREWGKIVTVAAWASHPSKGMHILRRALNISGLSATLVTGKPHEVVRDTLCSSGIFVFPSVYQETFGLSLVEAMSCGCACISSDVAGPLEIVSDGENGILVPRGDAEALADAMLTLHNDPLYTWQLGASARRTVESRYTLHKYGERLKRFYESLL